MLYSETRGRVWKLGPLLRDRMSSNMHLAFTLPLLLFLITFQQNRVDKCYITKQNGNLIAYCHQSLLQPCPPDTQPSPLDSLCPKQHLSSC